MAVGLQLAGKNDFVKVQENINNNLTKLDNQIDFNLLATLGIEYGGILNNTNAKVSGKAYYDTTGKKLYKCTANTSLNYADASYFMELSNNDLLGKLQNLTNLTDVFRISLSPSTPVGTRFKVPFVLKNYKKISVVAYEIFDSETNTNLNFQSHWNIRDIRTFQYHLRDKYCIVLVTDNDTNELIVKRLDVGTDKTQYISRLEIWGELPII